MAMEHQADDVALHRITLQRARVLDLIRKGRKNREIAEALTISARTVARHCEDLRGLTGCHTRAELAVWWDRHEARWEELNGPGRSTK